ncbi:MAG: ABC transporter ATP-binding protein [Leptospirillia bacterium]
MSPTFKRLMRYVRPYGGRVAVTILLGLVVSGCTGAIAWAIKPLLDKVLIARDEEMLALLPWMVLGLYFVKAGASYVQTVVMQGMGFTVIRDVRNDLYKAIVALPTSRFNQTASGELMSRMINDASLLQGAVSTVVKDLVQASATVVVLTGLVISLDPMLALLALGVLPLSIWPMRVLSRRVRKRTTSGQEAVSAATQVLTETIGGIRVVKAFGAEFREIDRFSIANEEYRRKSLKVIKAANIFSPMMEIVGALGVALILAIGGGKVISGDITPGDFLSFVAACMMLYAPVRVLSAANSVIQQALAAAGRVFDLMDLPKESDPAHSGTLVLEQLEREIVFDSVSHRYDGEEGSALADISLTAGVGDIVALVGPSGAGKTTLVNLIPRFIDPETGNISIDGHNTREYDLASLRRQIAIVGQDTVLFDDTLATNIAYGAGDRQVSLEEIVAAATKAHAHEFIKDLPQGYDTPAGERGVLLSGGQRQRIAIARAILKDAPILVLDEATSALDSESEKHVQAALSALMADRTTFVIAHRLSTVRHATQILVIDGGRIVERGTHDELLEASGLYRKLYDLQFQPEPQGAG